MDVDDWAETLGEERAAKDRYFANNPHSPLSGPARDSFECLEYFPPDPDLRFELPLHRFDEPETMTVETTQDGAREYRRVGEFRFAAGGTEETLTAYADGPDEERLWVPFRDGTSGEETYPAGRYLDLDAESIRTAGGDWVLDFNRAYSPFCAFSDAYECPLVPMENWLSVRVEAGERYAAGAEEGASDATA